MVIIVQITPTSGCCFPFLRFETQPQSKYTLERVVTKGCYSEGDSCSSHIFFKFLVSPWSIGYPLLGYQFSMKTLLSKEVGEGV